MTGVEIRTWPVERLSQFSLRYQCQGLTIASAELVEPWRLHCLLRSM